MCITYDAQNIKINRGFFLNVKKTITFQCRNKIKLKSFLLVVHHMRCTPSKFFFGRAKNCWRWIKIDLVENKGRLARWWVMGRKDGQRAGSRYLTAGMWCNQALLWGHRWRDARILRPTPPHPPIFFLFEIPRAQVGALSSPTTSYPSRTETHTHTTQTRARDLATLLTEPEKKQTTNANIYYSNAIE